MTRNYAAATLRLIQTTHEQALLVEPETPVEPEIPEPTPLTVIWRMNPRAGVRCPSCGRMFRRVGSLPVKRTCVNCGSAFNLQRDPSGSGGVHFAQVLCAKEEAVSEHDRLISGWLRDFSDLSFCGKRSLHTSKNGDNEAISTSPTVDEAISTSPTVDPLVKMLMDKTVLKLVHRHLVTLGMELADRVRETDYPSERPLKQTFVYKRWVDGLDKLFKSLVRQPYSVRVRDYSQTVYDDQTPGLKFFGGRAGVRIIMLTTNGAMSIQQYLAHRHDNFQELLREYYLVMRHEATHLQQYSRMPVNPETGQPQAGTQRRQSVPGHQGYLTRPLESGAVANELAELVMQGQDIQEYPRFQRFLQTYGSAHKATKRVLKLTYQILQQEEDPALLKRFAQQVQRLPGSEG